MLCMLLTIESHFNLYFSHCIQIKKFIFQWIPKFLIILSNHSNANHYSMLYSMISLVFLEWSVIYILTWNLFLKHFLFLSEFRKQFNSEVNILIDGFYRLAYFPFETSKHLKRFFTISPNIFQFCCSTICFSNTINNKLCINKCKQYWNRVNSCLVVLN